MGRVNEEEFLQDCANRSTGSKGKYVDLRKAQMVRGWLHPLAKGLWERWQHGSIPSLETFQVDGVERSEYRWRFYNDVGTDKNSIPTMFDPLDALVVWCCAGLDSGIAPSEVILGAEMKNKDGQAYRVKFDMLDLSARDKKNRYKTNVTPRRGFVIPIVRVRDRDPENKVQLLDTVETIGKKFLERKNKLVEDFGSKRGNPFVFDPNDPATYPIAFDFHYDPTKKGSDMYSVANVDRELAPVTDDVVQILSGDLKNVHEIDLDKICGPGDPEAMLKSLQSVWVSQAYPFEKFRDWYLANRGPAPASGPTPATAQPTASASPAAAPTAHSEAKCPSCGAGVKSTMKFCANCGAEVNAAPARPQGEVQTAAGETAQLYQCPDQDCGVKAVPVGPENRCPRCGVKMDMSKPAGAPTGPSDDDVPF